MPLPDINYCIVCEGVRIEERHKATILGFFNILPWVEVKVAEFGAGVIPLMFLFGTTGGTGKANFQIVLLNPDGTELVKMPELSITFKEGFGQMNVGIDVATIYQVPGTYTVQLRVSGEQKYESSFSISLDPTLKP